jgi:hypothetical protein
VEDSAPYWKLRVDIAATRRFNFIGLSWAQVDGSKCRLT